MRSYLLTLVASVAAGVAGAAESIGGRVEGELADRYIGCAAYFQVVAKCISQPDDPAEGKAMAEKYRAEAEDFIIVAVSMISSKTVLAKHSLNLKDMMRETDSDCGNIAILMDQHADFCRRLSENPESVMNEMVERYTDQ